MEEINLKELFNYFISKILIVIVIVSISIVSSIVYEKIIKVPMYSSYTTIVLTRSANNENDNATITQNDVLLNQKLVATYRQIMKSKRVLDQVIANLNLDVTVNELSERITVTNETDTELIKIAVSSKDSKEAKDIANEIAKVFSKEIVEIYDINNVSIIDAATEASVAYNVNPIKGLVIFMVVGLILSCAIIFVMFYFDTTVKSTEEIENKLNLTILGTIPKVEPKNSKKKLFKKGA